MSRKTPGSTAKSPLFFKLALCAPMLALSLVGVTALLVLQAGKRSSRARADADVSIERVEEAHEQRPRELRKPNPKTGPSAVAKKDPGAVASPSLPAATPVADGALDADGQALLDQLVEDEQQTLQPEDLEVEPTPPPLDLRTVKAYRDQNIDADGNLN